MKIKQRHVLVVLLVVTVLLLGAGCGSGGSTVVAPDTAQTLDGFSLEVLDGTYMEGGGAAGFRLTSEVYAGEVVVSIAVEGADSLKALYCGLDYDAGRYAPVSVRATGALSADGGEVLEPEELLRRDAGRIDYGQLLPWPAEAAGFSGDAVLAVATFRCEPDNWSRETSDGAPLNRRSQSPLTWDDETGTLQWPLILSGDGNHSGYVEVADLTPIGQRYKSSTGGGPFPEDDSRCLIDYDYNGEITFYDIQGIARNYGCSIEGYHVYASNDPLDVPADYDEPNGPGTELLATLEWADGYWADDSVRRQFSYQVESPVAGAYYWVRPYHDDGTGTCSTIAGGP